MQRYIRLLSSTRIGWVGLETASGPAIIHNNGLGSRQVLPLDTIDADLFCKIGWDLGIRSPSGFSNQAANPEMAYAMYVDDFHPDELAQTIWAQLQRLNLIISTTAPTTARLSSDN